MTDSAEAVVQNERAERVAARPNVGSLMVALVVVIGLRFEGLDEDQGAPAHCWPKGRPSIDSAIRFLSRLYYLPSFCWVAGWDGRGYGNESVINAQSGLPRGEKWDGLSGKVGQVRETMVGGRGW